MWPRLTMPENVDRAVIDVSLVLPNGVAVSQRLGLRGSSAAGAAPSGPDRLC